MEGTGASRAVLASRLRQFLGALWLFLYGSVFQQICRFARGPLYCQVVGGVCCASGSSVADTELLGPVAVRAWHEWENLSLKPGVGDRIAFDCVQDLPNGSK